MQSRWPRKVRGKNQIQASDHPLQEIRHQKIFDLKNQIFDKKKMSLVLNEIEIINKENSSTQSDYYLNVLRIFNDYFLQNDYTHQFTFDELYILQKFHDVIIETAIPNHKNITDAYQVMRSLSDLIIDFKLKVIQEQLESDLLNHHTAAQVKFDLYYEYFKYIAAYLKKHPQDNLGHIRDHFKDFFASSQKLIQHHKEMSVDDVEAEKKLVERCFKTRAVCNLLFNLCVPHPNTFSFAKVDLRWVSTALSGISKSFKNTIFPEADSIEAKALTRHQDTKYLNYLKQRAELASVFESPIPVDLEWPDLTEGGFLGEIMIDERIYREFINSMLKNSFTVATSISRLFHHGKDENTVEPSSPSQTKKA